jgi:hypothetical protein
VGDRTPATFRVPPLPDHLQQTVIGSRGVALPLGAALPGVQLPAWFTLTVPGLIERVEPSMMQFSVPESTTSEPEMDPEQFVVEYPCTVTLQLEPVAEQLHEAGHSRSSAKSAW